MIIVGLTGSIGMGKSTTSGMFRDEGIPVHDSDKAVHELYASDAIEPIGRAFPGVIDSQGVNRSALAKVVLSDAEALKRLEGIIHPLVAKNRHAFLALAKLRGRRICVLDVPLLFETRLEGITDIVVVVTATPAVQKQRVLARPGMTAEQFGAILSRQMPDHEKRRRAHFIVDTSFGVEAARRQVRSLVRTLSR